MAMGKVTQVNFPKAESEPNMSDLTPQRLDQLEEYGRSFRTHMNNTSYEGKVIIGLVQALRKERERK